MFPGVFGSKKSAATHRFADLTFDELTNLRAAIKSYLRYLYDAAKKETSKGTRQMFNEEAQIIAGLYDEVNATIQQYRDDQHNLGAFHRGLR